MRRTKQKVASETKSALMALMNIAHRCSGLRSFSLVLEGVQTESRNFDLRSRSILRGARCALERTNTAAAGSDRSARGATTVGVCVLLFGQKLCVFSTWMGGSRIGKC